MTLKRRVAITGSHGLIGGALARSLTGDGHTVIPIVRSTGPGIRWDIEAGEIDAAGLEGLDAIVHLAGEGIGNKRWTGKQKRRVLESRAKGTALLAGALAALRQPPHVLVSGSAIGYYGDRGDEILDESSAPGDLFLSEVCQAWEAATAPAAAAGIRVATIRTGIVLAAKGDTLRRLLLLFRPGLGGRFGSGRQWWSWITLADEVAAIRFILDGDLSGPVNLTAPNPVTNAVFAKTLGKALHRPAVVPIPRFGPRLVIGRQLADELLFTSARVRPGALIDAGYVFRHPDLPAGFEAALAR